MSPPQPPADPQAEELNLTIAQVDSELGALHNQISQLKSRIQRLSEYRNSLAPIFHLPPEIVGQIFLCLRYAPPSPVSAKTASRAAADADAGQNGGSDDDNNNDDDDDDYGELGCGNHLDRLHMVSHVCRMWRAIALALPELWTLVPAATGRKVEWTELLLARSGAFSLLDVRIGAGGAFRSGTTFVQREGDGMARNERAVMGVLREFERIRTLEVDPAVGPELLKGWLKQPAERLEALRVRKLDVDDEGYSDRGMGPMGFDGMTSRYNQNVPLELFAGQARRLAEIEVDTKLLLDPKIEWSFDSLTTIKITGRRGAWLNAAVLAGMPKLRLLTMKLMPFDEIAELPSQMDPPDARIQFTELVLLDLDGEPRICEQFISYISFPSKCVVSLDMRASTTFPAVAMQGGPGNNQASPVSFISKLKSSYFQPLDHPEVHTIKLEMNYRYICTVTVLDPQGTSIFTMSLKFAIYNNEGMSQWLIASLAIPLTAARVVELNMWNKELQQSLCADFLPRFRNLEHLIFHTSYDGECTDSIVGMLLVNPFDSLERLTVRHEGIVVLTSLVRLYKALVTRWTRHGQRLKLLEILNLLGDADAKYQAEYDQSLAESTAPVYESEEGASAGGDEEREGDEPGLGEVVDGLRPGRMWKADFEARFREVVDVLEWPGPKKAKLLLPEGRMRPGDLGFEEQGEDRTRRLREEGRMAL